MRLLPRAVAERSGVLVLERDGSRLTVATADPTNVMALDDVKLYTGVPELKVVVATDSQVRDHLARAWSLSEDSTDVHTMFQEIGQEAEVEADVSVQAVEAAPIVRLVDVVLADAVRARASRRPRRAAGGRAAHPLPRRRAAARRHDRAQGRDGGRGQPHQDRVGPRHRRAPRARRTAARSSSSTG